MKSITFTVTRHQPSRSSSMLRKRRVRCPYPCKDHGLTEWQGDKFTVTYDPVEKLHKGEVTELPSHPSMYAYIPKPMLSGMLSMFGLWAVYGIMHSSREGSLNEKFPEIKTTSFKEIVGAWKGH